MYGLYNVSINIIIPVKNADNSLGDGFDTDKRYQNSP